MLLRLAETGLLICFQWRYPSSSPSCPFSPFSLLFPFFPHPLHAAALSPLLLFSGILFCLPLPLLWPSQLPPLPNLLSLTYLRVKETSLVIGFLRLARRRILFKLQEFQNLSDLYLSKALVVPSAYVNCPQLLLLLAHYKNIVPPIKLRIANFLL